jgi:hypothetical protein
MDAAALRAQDRVRSLGKTIGDALLDYPYVINGMKKPLRDWLGSEIKAHGETMLLSAGTAMRNANYLISVGNAAGERKIGTLDTKVIEALRKQADKLPA